MKWQEIYDTCYFKEKQTTASYLEDLLMAKHIECSLPPLPIIPTFM